MRQARYVSYATLVTGEKEGKKKVEIGGRGRGSQLVKDLYRPGINMSMSFFFVVARCM